MYGVNLVLNGLRAAFAARSIFLRFAARPPRGCLFFYLFRTDRNAESMHLQPTAQERQEKKGVAWRSVCALVCASGSMNGMQFFGEGVRSLGTKRWLKRQLWKLFVLGSATPRRGKDEAATVRAFLTR